MATALRLRCDAAAGRQRAGRLSTTQPGRSTAVGGAQRGGAGGRPGRSKALPRAHSAAAGHADLVHRVADQVCTRPAT